MKKEDDSLHDYHQTPVHTYASSVQQYIDSSLGRGQRSKAATAYQELLDFYKRHLSLLSSTEAADLHTRLTRMHRQISSPSEGAWQKPAAIIIGLLFLFTFFVFLQPGILGLLGFEETQVISQNLNLYLSNSSEITLQLQGAPGSIFVSGAVYGNGTAKVEIASNGIRKVLYESTSSGTAINAIINETVTQELRTFDRTCLETCALENTTTEVTLIVELTDAIIRLDNITYSVAAANRPPEFTRNVTRITFKQNETYQFTASQLFVDPENDELTITVTSADKITADQSGDTITLRPERTFAGTRLLGVLATDGENVVREEIHVEVLRVTTAYVDERVQNTLDLKDTVPVIIILHENISDGKKSRETLQEKKQRLDTDKNEVLDDLQLPRRGAVLPSVLTINTSTIPVLVMNVSEAGFETLQSNPLIKGIYLDEDFAVSTQDSVPKIGAPLVWSDVGVTGEGVGVCVLDTGIDATHPAFQSRVSGGYDFVNDDPDPTDDSADSHGTHVSGIVVAVAPGAHIVPVKVCNANGTCKASKILAGIDYCTQQASALNITAISGSIGDGKIHTATDCPEFLEPALDAASSQGVTPVFATGNDAAGFGVNYPACSTLTIGAGASDKNDNLWPNTNQGPLLDILAPGVDINSTIVGEMYGVRSGTSPAVPHVTGTIALLRQAKPSLANTDEI
ncbi:S8 family serine peptidase, partial [Candidatus Woesearchaeota archaeon]|nr:S8 family serine peptidase [Candidatus Woesearchaeota archaeon]